MVNWRSLVMAAGISIPASPAGGNVLVNQGPQTAQAMPVIDAAKPTPTFEIEAENRRPWYFGRISSQIVEIAVANRATACPSEQASSIAARIVDAALAPPQVTPLLSAASSILIEDGENIPPSHVKLLVDMASTAYNEVRTSGGFNDYLHYISANLKNFKIEAVPTGTQVRLAPEVETALQKLEQSPDGRDAVNTGKNLYAEVMRDAGITPQRPKPGHKDREQ